MSAPACVYCGEGAKYRERTGARRTFCDVECKLAMVGGEDGDDGQQPITLVCQEQGASITIRKITARLSATIGSLMAGATYTNDTLDICGSISADILVKPIFTWLKAKDDDTITPATDLGEFFEIAVTKDSYGPFVRFMVKVAQAASYLEVPELLKNAFSTLVGAIVYGDMEESAKIEYAVHLVASFDMALFVEMLHLIKTDAQDPEEIAEWILVAIIKQRDAKKFTHFATIFPGVIGNVKNAMSESRGILTFSRAILFEPQTADGNLMFVKFVQSYLDTHGMDNAKHEYADYFYSNGLFDTTSPYIFNYLMPFTTPKLLEFCVVNYILDGNEPVFRFIRGSRENPRVLASPNAIVETLLRGFSMIFNTLHAPLDGKMRIAQGFRLVRIEKLFEYATTHSQFVKLTDITNNVVQEFSRISVDAFTTGFRVTMTKEYLKFILNPTLFTVDKSWAYQVFKRFLDYYGKFDERGDSHTVPSSFTFIATYVAKDTVGIRAEIKRALQSDYRLGVKFLLKCNLVRPKEVLYAVFDVLDNEPLLDYAEEHGIQNMAYMFHIISVHLQHNTVPEYLHLIDMFFTKDTSITENPLRVKVALFRYLYGAKVIFQQKGVENMSYWKREFLIHLTDPSRKHVVPKLIVAQFEKLLKIE